MRLLLERILEDDKQTIGKLYLLDSNDYTIDYWYSLELPDIDNQRRISRIPSGTYKASKHVSPRHGRSLWIREVPNRSEILIHSGNFHYQILGCILIGKQIDYIDEDDYLDVANSRDAINELMGYLEDYDGVMIEIKNELW
jgi:hypothetical protein